MSSYYRVMRRLILIRHYERRRFQMIAAVEPRLITTRFISLRMALLHDAAA